MVGLQATGIKNQLGPLLNGWTNYETWVPDKKMYCAGTEEFFKKYQARARRQASMRSATISAAGAMPTPRFSSRPSRAPRPSNDAKLADYIKKNKFKTIHGDIEFGADGEWKKSGMLQVQYHSIKQGADRRDLARHGLPDRAHAGRA